MEISASANRSFALHIRTHLNLPFSVDSHVLPPMYSVAALLTLVASASAYLVTVPNGSRGWTSVGAQP